MKFGLVILCLWAASVTPAFSAAEPAVAPVLNRPLARGEIIRGQDLQMLQLKHGASHLVYITDPGQLAGMSAKRPLRPGVPLRASDISEPRIVAKGDIVTMAFEAPGMRLSVRGKALDDGLLGASVRVLNTQTNRTVEATVVAAGYVLVSQPNNHVQSANSGAAYAR